MIYGFDKVVPLLFWLGFFVLGIATSLDGRSKIYSTREPQIAEAKARNYDAAK